MTNEPFSPDQSALYDHIERMPTKDGMLAAWSLAASMGHNLEQAGGEASFTELVNETMDPVIRIAGLLALTDAAVSLNGKGQTPPIEQSSVLETANRIRAYLLSLCRVVIGAGTWDEVREKRTAAMGARVQAP